MQDAVIVGAGGLGREVIEWVEDINRACPSLRIVGVLDDDVVKHGRHTHGVPILGGVGWLTQRPGLGAIVAVGSPVSKRKLVQRLRPLVRDFPAVIHPRAVVGRYVTVGDGVILCPDAILTTDIEIGAFVTFNYDLTVGHDVKIADYCTLAPGVHVSGNVTLGEGVDVGAGAALVPGIEVGSWSIIGAGAVVSSSLPENCTAVGVPARPIKTRTPGWHLT